MKVVKAAERHPFCVDLDGTLIKTDSLTESILSLVAERPIFVFLLPIWLLKGIAHFKFKVARHVDLEVDRLPYSKQVLDIIAAQKLEGRPIVLATASPYPVAEKIAEHLGIFSEVLASNESTNLKSSLKAELLVDKYGAKGFDYIGNSKDDLPVWAAAQRAYLVNCSARVQSKANKLNVAVEIVRIKKPLLRLIAKQIRVHQWAKNILIFSPMILAQNFLDPISWWSCIHAFLAFSFVSSSVYIVNDVLDLESDRAHVENKERPFASGDLSLVWAVILFPLLIVSGFILSALLSWQFFAVIASYFALTSAYSFRLKQLPIADIIVLASLYSWRVFAGSIATGVNLSEWFLTFSTFFFLSLALVKRCSELIVVQKLKKVSNKRRGYFVTDLPLLVAFGVASGYLSILVLALYMNASTSKPVGYNPQMLWAMIPFMLFWISRTWLLSYRGQMPSDPLVFAMKDRVSYGVFIILAFLWLFGNGII